MLRTGYGMLVFMRAAAAAACFLLAVPVVAQISDYDRAAVLDVKLGDAVKGYNGVVVRTIRYALPRGGTMSGFVVTPADSRSGRRPGIVWMHSGGAIQFLGNAALMARAGAVSILTGPSEGQPSGTPEQARDALIASVVGLRRAADILVARDDVDASKIAIAGHSYGAMMSAVAVTEDPRFRAAVFEAGLLGMSIHIGTSPHPWAEGIRKNLGAGLNQFLETISVVDADNFIGKAPAIPKLFQSAWFDPGVPRTDSENFFRAATGPKELKWYDTGHDIDDGVAIADRARFLARALGLRNIEGVLREKGR